MLHNHTENRTWIALYTTSTPFNSMGLRCSINLGPALSTKYKYTAMMVTIGRGVFIRGHESTNGLCPTDKYAYKFRISAILRHFCTPANDISSDTLFTFRQFGQSRLCERIQGPETIRDTTTDAYHRTNDNDNRSATTDDISYFRLEQIPFCGTGTCKIT